MNRTRLVLTTAAALVATALAVPGAAQAAGDPPGTVVLRNGPSGAARLVALQAVTPQAVVYDDPSRGLVLQRRGERATTVIADEGQASAAGSLVLYQPFDAGPRWLDTATGRTGDAPATWQAVAPTGGLFVQRVDADRVRVQLQVAVSGAVTNLATVAYSGALLDLRIVGGPDGALVSRIDGPFLLAYVPYSGAPARVYDLGAVPDRASSFSCGAPTATDLACASAAAVVGARLGASAVTVLAPGDGSAAPAVLSSTAAVWSTSVPVADGSYQARARSVPLAGGAVSTGTAVFTRQAGVTSGIVSDGTAVYAEFGATAATAAISRFADARSTPVPVAKVGAADYLASAVAIAPGGRVGYIDNRGPVGAGWQRTVAVTAGRVTTTAEALVQPDAAGLGVALSGARTAWQMPTRPGQGSTFTVTSPLQSSTSVVYAVSLSGTRIVTPADGTVNTQVVVDLNSGARTPGGGVLWGDSRYFTKADSSLWVEDLATGAVRKVLAPSPSRPISGVLVWGDHVAVGRSDRTTTIVDVRAGTQVVVPGAVTDVSAAGYSTDSTLTSWDGSHTVTVDGDRLVSTATTMAWIGSDGRVRAAAVPWTTPDVPRSLGNPLAPPRVGVGQSWSFDLPTSAPLTRCTVDLLSAGRVVRALTCDPAFTGGGDAAATWDLRDTAGNAVPAGSYTWRVRAGNADGGLQQASGAPGAVTGTVVVVSS